jgi:hypothetical protein
VGAVFEPRVAFNVAELNVQNQQKIEWPAQLVVAKAYLDQLTRSLALPADRVADLQKAMQGAESSHMNKSKLAKLKGLADWSKPPARRRAQVTRHGYML